MDIGALNIAGRLIWAFLANASHPGVEPKIAPFQGKGAYNTRTVFRS